MKRREFVTGLTSLVSSAGLLTPKLIKATEKPIVFGVFPRRNIRVTMKLFLPLARYLEKSIGHEVKIETAKSFADFWRQVKERRYDLVHYNQYHYIVSHEHYGYDVILRNKELGKSTIAGSIIVRRDSGINSVADLKGKTILFGGGKTAMQSYIAAKWLLKRGGLQTGDYKEKFAINPPNTIISTYFKRADASGSGDVVMRLDNVMQRIDVSQLKFLKKTVQLPQLPWAIRRELDPLLKKKIQLALSTLKDTDEGRKILRSAKLDGLVPTVDSDYDRHRKIIRDVYGDNYGLKLIGK